METEVALLRILNPKKCQAGYKFYIDPSQTLLQREKCYSKTIKPQKF
jgi:hypothetical protein